MPIRTDRRARRAPQATRVLALTAALAAASAAALAPPAAHADVAVAGNGQWRAAGDRLRLQLSQSMAARAGDLRILAAGVDVTALARVPAPGQIEIDTRVAGLPAGESEIVVYLVEGAAWREVTRAPLKLLTARGFENAQFSPKLDLAGKSQFDETTRGTASAPPRPHFADATGRGGATFALQRGAFALDGSVNGSGSSHRPEALRYGERGAAASKVELSDYAVNARYGSTSLSIGHLSYGSHPMLLDGFASRGITLAQRVGQRVELSVNAMNGTSVVGTDNLLGLEDADHRVISGGAGVELFERAGALRADLLYMDASLQSRSNFNVGEIPDAEKSHGFGLRLSGATESNRLRSTLVFARSTYVNPFDPLLAQGGPLQPVRPATANGFSGEVSADLLQNSPLLSSSHPLTVNATVRHERIAPLFRSLGASLAADQRAERGALSVQMGGASLQVSHQRQRDNIDDVPTILATRTESSNASLSLPLAQWLPGATPGSWWPGTALQWQRTHQRAINAPVTEESGFAPTHRPDQVSSQQQLALTWTRERINWSYSLSTSTIDNRQVGRTAADFATLGHQVSVSLRATDALNLNLSLGRHRNDSLEKRLVTTSTSGALGFDWTIRDRWSLAANYSRTLGADARLLATQASRSAQAQLGWRFELPAYGHKLPGQVFVRASEQVANSRDSTFSLFTAGSNRALDAGLSLSLF